MGTAYIWHEQNGWINVAVPYPNMPMWRKWLARIPADQKYYNVEFGYWTLNLNTLGQSALKKRLRLCGWQVKKECPFNNDNKSNKHDKNANSLNELFAELYLLPNAPKYIVLSVYKALIKKYHPDVTDISKTEAEQKTRQLNHIKDLIFQIKGW